MRRSRRGRVLQTSALTLLTALLAFGYAGGTALVVERDVASPDAIVMLASHEWERLPSAAALARQHPSATVLLTVPTVIGPFNCYRCPDRPAWLEKEGVAGRRIHVLAQTAANTHEEALAARAYA